MQDTTPAPAQELVTPGEHRIGPFYLLGPIPTFIPAPGDEPRPLALSVRQGFSHHSNVYALPDQASPESAALEGSDNVSETGLRLSYDNQISGQLFSLWADVSRIEYRRFDELDHTAWNLGGRWAWQAGRQWYGTLLLDVRRFLNRLQNQNVPVRNVIEHRTLAASAGYRFDPRWSAFVGVDFQDRDNSAAILEQDDVRENGVEVGVRFEPPEARIDSSLVYRQVDGRYAERQTLDAVGAPLAVGVDNAFTDRSVLARLSAAASAVSRVVGELGWTQREFDTFSERDFSGPTGYLAWQWQPSNALASELFLRRSLGAGDQISSNFIDTRQFGALVHWRPTGKLAFSGQVARDDYRFAGDPATATGALPERHDRATVYALRAAWEARRNVELAAEYRHEKRSSNFAVFSYDADIIGLSLALRFD